MKQPLFFFFLFVILSSSAYGLSVRGGPMPVNLYYEYGDAPQYTYTFGTDSGTQDYLILKAYDKGYDITHMLELSKSQFDDMPRNTGGEFTVTVNMNQEQIPPGRHEALVLVRETQTNSAGTVGGLAEVAIRFRIVSLYPTEFLNWRISSSNANQGEQATVTTRLENWGIPDITDAKVNFKIYDKDNNLVGETDSKVQSVESKKTIEFQTKISTKGLEPDDYKIRAKLTYAGEESIKETTFRVGTKEVLINRITESFVPGAINRFMVNIESRWNSPLEEVEGKVQIFPKDDNSNMIKEFRLLSTSLYAWEKKQMEGYFDTDGMALGEYNTRVFLTYDEEETQKNFLIRIEESSTAETVEQVPGMLALLTIENLLFIMLVAVLGINVWYLIRKRKR